MTSMITLSSDQQVALDWINKWIDEGKSFRELTFGGFAGTGKTTLIRQVLNDKANQKLAISVMSFTGKACSVLWSKDIPAQTIHSSIYHVEVDKKNEPIFHLRSRIEDCPELIIVDEASMVSSTLYEDLCSFLIPVLWVGDHGQLEPIGDNPGLMLDPTVKLEKIHRQAEGNPIIQFSQMVRTGHRPVITDHGLTEEGVYCVLRKRELTKAMFLEADQIIVGLNRTRVKLNKWIRANRSFPSEPVIGDRVICLKNHKAFGVFNGLQGVIKGIIKDNDPLLYQAEIETEDGHTFQGRVLKDQFNKEKGLVDATDGRKDTYWDYGYAITCHKAQGSEWDKVVVVEDYCPYFDMNRWRYTAVTRATKELVYAV